MKKLLGIILLAASVGCTTANAAAAIDAIAFIFISITVQANLHPRG